MRYLSSLLLIIAFSLHSELLRAQDEGLSLSSMKWRSVGPALTSGRIADMAVDPENSNIIYLATASSGVWKSTNNATSWTPIFDGEKSFSTGCVAINPHNRHEIWVGTGENNNQRSVAYGDGVYKSCDGGKSWENVGLGSSEHIGMIRFHPEDPQTVYVAAYGPLWNKGGERGIYKSTDGGKQWRLVAEVDENTGFNEVHIHPEVKGLMFATAHQRRRRVFTYLSGGPSSGLYRSTDDGEHWEEVKSGLPSGDKGRLSLAISPADPDRMYLMIEGHGTYVSDDRGASWSKKSGHNTAGNYYTELIAHPTDKDVVYSMDTYCHVSKNGGVNFERVSEKFKHVDNHCLWIDPSDPDHMRMGCDGGFYQTYDGMRSWLYSANLPITQFYRVSTDNAKPFYNIYGGTQDNFSLKGPSRTTSQHGILNSDWTVTNTGDGFETQVDPQNPNIVYAQAQYGWLVRHDAASGESVSIKPVEGKDDTPWRWNWDAPLMISPHKAERLYFCANVVFRSDDRGQSWTRISEDLSRGADRNTFKIMDRYWSSDAVARHQSTSMYGNIVAFNESPLVEGLLYAGTDDGLLRVKMPDSDQWTTTHRFEGVPEETYVQGIWPSQHEKGRLYAAFNNHKNGDFKPYLLRSEDGGKTWSSIAADLPVRGTVYSFAEDHVNPDLLFAGTEFGFFTSWDGGQNWNKMTASLPTNAVKDMEIQKRENDLVIATFGRGFYVLDDYSPLRELSTLNEQESHVFAVKEGLVFEEATPLGYSGGGFQGAGFFRTPNPEPGVVFTFYLPEVPKTLKAMREEKEKELKEADAPIPDPSGAQFASEELEKSPYVLMVIRNKKGGDEIYRETMSASKGIRRVHWDCRYPQSGSFRGGESLGLRSASRLPSGAYWVEFHLVHNTVQRPIGTGRSFSITELDQLTLPATSSEQLVSFQREADRVAARMEQLRKGLEELSGEADRLHDASRIIPGVPSDRLATAQALRADIQKLNTALYGERKVASLEKAVAPGLRSRLNSVLWNSYSSSSDPTQMQREQLGIVVDALGGLEQEVDRLAEAVLALHEDLRQFGMPALPQGMSRQK